MLTLFRLSLLFIAAVSFAIPPVVDFTGSAAAQGWSAAHDILALEPSNEGLIVRAAGGDPFLHGPRGDFTSTQPLLFNAT